MKKQPRKPKPVEIRLGRRVDGGAIRYVLSSHQNFAIGGAISWAVLVFAALTDRDAIPWWLALVPTPLLLLGLSRRGIDVRPDSDEIVVWRWFVFRYWSRTVPLVFPGVDAREVEMGTAVESIGIRRVSTLHFGPVSMKDVNRKILGRVLGELRSIIAERETARGEVNAHDER